MGGGSHREREPEPNVLLRIDHADLACQSTSVYQQIEVHHDPRDSKSRILNDLLSVLERNDTQVACRELLGDERRNV